MFLSFSYNKKRDIDIAERFSEYPKLKELVERKNELVAKRATPAMYLKTDLKTFDLSSLDMKFDVILIDPPWAEYKRRCPGAIVQNMTRSFE